MIPRAPLEASLALSFSRRSSPFIDEDAAVAGLEVLAPPLAAEGPEKMDPMNSL
jgi:hypothetical protein